MVYALGNASSVLLGAEILVLSAYRWVTHEVLSSAYNA